MKLATLRQRLFDVAAALSLALCLVIAALWARSLGHFEMISFRYSRWPRANEVHTYSGFLGWYSNTFRCEVTYSPLEPRFFEGMSDENVETFRKSQPPGAYWAFVGDDGTMVMSSYRAGFAYRHTPYQTAVSNGDYYILAVRPWLPTLLAAILPVFWMIQYRRRHGTLWQFGVRELFIGVTVLAALLGSGLWLMR